jgi:thioredoxin-like negative regulator of GroEL
MPDQIEVRNAAPTQPRLVFFYSPLSGRCRRVEGFIAQVVQRRHNHDTFRFHYVDEAERPDLVRRFGVTEIPTLAVVVEKKVVAKLEHPSGPKQIEAFLAPWLSRGARAAAVQAVTTSASASASRAGGR